MQQPKAQLPDTDPFVHLSATERFAQAIERRDALIRERGTPQPRGRNTPPARSTSVAARLKNHRST